jgi:hypothetical protein
MRIGETRQYLTLSQAFSVVEAQTLPTALEEAQIEHGSLAVALVPASWA